MEPLPARAKPLHTARVAAIAVDALGRGAELKSAVGLIKWAVAGRCLAPVLRTVKGAPYERYGHYKRFDSWSKQRGVVAMIHNVMPDGPLDVSIDVEAPCRKCTECMKARARHWAQRAQSELRASSRTWFGTITIAPEWHARFRDRTRYRLDRGGTSLDELSPVEQYRETEAEIARELGLMWKRLRKSGGRFRFILVAESSQNHQAGLPHYHCMVHEIADPIRHSTLQRVWPYGYTAWKLVPASDSRAAWYVCKYLAKDAVVRVRASIRYGLERNTVSDPNKVFSSSLEDEKIHSTLCEIKSLPPTEGDLTTETVEDTSPANFPQGNSFPVIGPHQRKGDVNEVSSERIPHECGAGDGRGLSKRPIAEKRRHSRDWWQTKRERDKLERLQKGEGAPATSPGDEGSIVDPFDCPPF